MEMRFGVPFLLLALAVVVAGRPEPAAARPEFARREMKACGFCHINPRGGGARNQNGITYAKNEFKFPQKTGNLASFRKGKERDSMIHCKKMVDIQHIPAAVKGYSRLVKSVKSDAAKKLVAERLHALDVKGTEILGQSRRLMRSKDREDRAEGIELLVLLTHEYKGLDCEKEAREDLKELRREKEYRALIKQEQREAKARLLYLDAVRAKSDGQPDRATKTLEKLVKNYAGTRAAKDAKKELPKPKPGK